MSERLTSESSLDAWRRNIRADIAARYHLGMGVAILCSEGAATALPWLEAAAAQGAGEEAAACARIEALNALGRRDEAQRLHEAAARSNPKYAVTGFCDLAAVYRDSCSIDVAAVVDMHRRAAAAAQAAGDSVAALSIDLQLAAHLLTSGGETEETAETARRALNALNAGTAPLDVKALDAAATFAFAAHQHGDASSGLAACRQALQRPGPAPDPWLLSRLVQAALVCAAPAAAADQAATAVALAAVVTAADFDDLDAVEAVCRRAALSDQWAAAEAAAAKVLAARPERGGAAVTLARALLYRRDAVSAVDALQRSRAAGGATGENAVDLLTLLLTALIIQNRAGEAAPVLTDAVAAGLDAASAAFYRGLISLGQDDLSAAAAAFDEARRGSSPPPIAVAAAGLTAGLRGEAVAADRLHATATPRNDFSELMRGLTLYAMGRGEEAKAALQATLAATPRRVWFLSRHFPRQFDLLAAAFHSVGWNLQADTPLDDGNAASQTT
jgi:hypothetical protein